jgi:hypothetical protein
LITEPTRDDVELADAFETRRQLSAFEYAHGHTYLPNRGILDRSVATRIAEIH